jgi:hypothetical protein
MTNPVLRSALLLLLAIPAWAQTSPPPRIFYSDLDSGPALGGKDNQGAIVTIYGKRFGAARGNSSVSIGGSSAASYLSWSDTKIAFQIGDSAKSGEIVVHVPGIAESNGLPFIVRHGKIYCVAVSGSDHNAGSFQSPWRTIAKAKNAMGPGDITYVMDGVSQTGIDDYGASLAIASSGEPGRPKALVAYPGASVVVGAASGPEFAIRTPAIGPKFNYWTLAGLTLRGGNQSLKLVLVSGWRVVGNDMSCPNGDGAVGCFEAAGSENLRVLGNFIHDSGRKGASKQYHSLYLTTDSNHIEVGWNVIANNRSCRGIQFHSSPLDANSGFNQFDLIVHDNLIHGQVCDGINFATIDPSKGPVLAYNNVIYNVGTGPDPQGELSNYACISSPGITNRGAPGSGTAEFFNNTLYDCGGRRGGNSGAFHVGAGSPLVRIRNNIVYAQKGESYLEAAGAASRVTGSHNLWFGAGAGPAQLTANINADPKFLDLAGLDFHLQIESPGIGKGSNTGIAADFDGVIRPPNNDFDLGAFQSLHSRARTAAASRP